MNIAAYIDHTVLKSTTTQADIVKLCTEALENNFAAVCVPPLFVKMAKQMVAKVAEIILAIIDGADELDVVINISAIKNNDWQFLANEINTLMPIIRKQQKVIKIIIESGILTNAEIIKCCDLYGAAGVDFLKTSTGYAEVGATLEAVVLIRKHLTNSIKIKASGGIKSYTFAKQLIDAGVDRLGCSSSLQIVQESNKLD